MLLLLRTLIEIILLRKGPEALPRTRIVLILAVGLWLLSSLIAMIGVQSYTGFTFLLGLLTGGMALVIYALLINSAGKIARLEQSLSAIIGCGSMLSLIALTVQGLSAHFLAENQVNAIIALIWLWSVPVEGHIIARAIDRPWFVGFFAAMTVFFVQLFLLSSLDPTIGSQGQESDPAFNSEPA